MRFENVTLPDDLVERALAVATEAHRGQFRRDGVTPYLGHPKAVAELVKTPVEKAVAVLHDSVEDSDITLEDLAKLFPKEVVEAVAALTKRDGEQYLDYIKRVNQNSIARKVKMADMFVNISDAPTAKAKAKYFQAFKRLVR
jgi:(p)ppGpp synthase/HD superfamily hydrolase